MRTRRDRLRAAAPLLLAALGLLAGCGDGGNLFTGLRSAAGSDGSTPTATEVSIRDDYFLPSSDTVRVNGTVTWRNDGGQTHTTTAQNGDWNASLPPGLTFQHTFTQEGTYPYSCTIHGEVGEIVVVP